MFADIDLFKISSAMARHAGQRQALVAQNVANADTPGFRARDIADFKTTYAPRDGAQVQRATRIGHLNGQLAHGPFVPTFDRTGQASVNGNKVSLEAEMLKSVGAKRQHDRALAIYKSALGILRSTIRSN